MAKGKTNQPLQFMVPAEWLESTLFATLAQQGHEVIPLPKECLNIDIMFNVNCHFMTDTMMQQKGIIDVALKSARKRKQGKVVL